MAETLSTYLIEFKASMDGLLSGFQEATTKGDQLNKKLDDSKTKTQEAAEGLDKYAGTFALVSKAAIAAGTAIVAGLTAAVKATADYGEQLNKLHEITGIQTELIAGLGLAAEASETDMNSLATGLKFLAKNMETAIDKAGPQRDAFRDLGISSKDLADTNGDLNAVFRLVADRMAALPDPTQKSELAMRLLGRSGTELIPILNLGSSGLDDFQKKAERLGVTMSGEAAAASDKFNDTLGELSAAVKGLAITIGTDLIPIVQKYVEQLRDGVIGVKDFAKAHDAIGLALKLVDEQLQRGLDSWDKLVIALTYSLPGAIAPAVNYFRTLRDVVGGKAEADSLNGAVSDLTTRMLAGSNAIAHSEAALRALGAPLPKITGDMEEFNKAVDNIVKSVVGDKTATLELEDAIRKLEAAHVPATVIAETLGKRLLDEKQRAEELHTTLPPVVMDYANLADSMKNLHGQMQALIDIGKTAKDINDEHFAGLNNQMILLEAVAKEIIDDYNLRIDASNRAMLTEMGNTAIQMQGLIDIAKGSQESYKIQADADQAVADLVKKNAADRAKAHEDAAKTMQISMATALGNVTSDLAKGLADSLLHWENWGRNLKSLVDNLASSLLQSFLTGLLNPLTSQLQNLGKQLADVLSKAISGGGGVAGTAATAAGGSTGGLGSIGGAIGSTLTNPWVLAGAGIAAAVGAWVKSQAHWEANTVVKNIENPFWQAWGQILPTDDLAALAAMPADQAKQIYQNLDAMNQNYLALINEYMKGGSDEYKVSQQSLSNTQPHVIAVLNALNSAISSGSLSYQGSTRTDVGTSGNEAYRKLLGLDIDTYKRLFPDMPQYAEGGYVERTGPAIVHQGEYVTPANRANAMQVALTLVLPNVRGAKDFIRDLQFNTDGLKTALRTALA